jgi:hypothetical protein
MFIMVVFSPSLNKNYFFKMFLLFFFGAPPPPPLLQHPLLGRKTGPSPLPH